MPPGAVAGARNAGVQTSSVGQLLLMTLPAKGTAQPLHHQVCLRGGLAVVVALNQDAWAVRVHQVSESVSGLLRCVRLLRICQGSKGVPSFFGSVWALRVCQAS